MESTAPLGEEICDLPPTSLLTVVPLCFLPLNVQLILLGIEGEQKQFPT